MRLVGPGKRRLDFVYGRGARSQANVCWRPLYEIRSPLLWRVFLFSPGLVDRFIVRLLSEQINCLDGDKA